MKIKVITTHGTYNFSRIGMVAHSALTSAERSHVVEAVRFFNNNDIKPCDIHYGDGTIVSFPTDEDEDMDNIADGMDVYRDIVDESAAWGGGCEPYEPNPYDGTYSEM